MGHSISFQFYDDAIIIHKAVVSIKCYKLSNSKCGCRDYQYHMLHVFIFFPTCFWSLSPPAPIPSSSSLHCLQSPSFSSSLPPPSPRPCYLLVFPLLPGFFLYLILYSSFSFSFCFLLIPHLLIVLLFLIPLSSFLTPVQPCQFIILPLLFLLLFLLLLLLFLCKYNKIFRGSAVLNVSSK